MIYERKKNAKRKLKSSFSFFVFIIQIPDNVKLQKETVLSLVKGSTVFINYLGACASHYLFLYILTCIFLKKLLRTSIDRQSNDSCFDAFFFIYSAHDVALSKQHKSISASDVLKALEMLEFPDMVEQLQGELQGS